MEGEDRIRSWLSGLRATNTRVEEAMEVRGRRTWIQSGAALQGVMTKHDVQDWGK